MHLGQCHNDDITAKVSGAQGQYPAHSENHRRPFPVQAGFRLYPNPDLHPFPVRTPEKWVKPFGIGV